MPYRRRKSNDQAERGASLPRRDSRGNRSKKIEHHTPFSRGTIPTTPHPRVIITGAAGLVGQNLILRLKEGGIAAITGIDKHPHNTGVLRALHPDIDVIEANLAEPGGWAQAFRAGDVLILAHAQIGGQDEEPFLLNNVIATRNVLDAAHAGGVAYIVHISSSVVNSAADDFYTRTKRQQEMIVADCGIPHVILRPTLMFGLFDRKHLGWLGRFMRRWPVFPLPGNGRFARQPLYVKDFCALIIECLHRRPAGQSYNISGLEVIDYADLIRAIKRATGAATIVVPIPIWIFRLLLQTYALIDKDPPFTSRQLAALTIPELFDVIDWPGLFGVQPTKLATALAETFQSGPYADIVLEF
jgi:nucleoside-diphosphate-sugar epimerase